MTEPFPVTPLVPASPISHRFIHLNAISAPEDLLDFEKHSLAADAFMVGSLAVASSVEAAQATGQPSEVSLPNPYTPADLKTKWGLTFSKVDFTPQLKDVPESARARSGVLDDENERIASLDGQTSADFVHDGRKRFDMAFEGQFFSGPNVEFTFDNMAIPPIINNARRDSDAASWRSWLTTGANPQQKENFAQWYTSEVAKVSQPETRATTIATLKQNYEGRVVQAMQDGWIDPKHYSRLQKNTKRADIHFFSPFSGTADQFGGIHAESEFMKSGILLPVAPSEYLVTHELGHAFGGVNSTELNQIIYAGKQKDYIPSNHEMQASAYLYSLVNEGYNEHVNLGLLTGQATTINPALRAEAGLESAGDSTDYQQRRGLFGQLVSGPGGNGQVSTDELRSVTTLMIERNTKGLDAYLTKKWGGQPVIKQMYDSLLESISATGYEPTTEDAIRSIRDKVLHSTPAS